MSPCMRRFFATATAIVIGAMWLSASAWGSTTGPDRARTVDPVAAAKSCAGQGRAGARLRKTDPSFLAGVMRCVLRTERQQLGLDYTQGRVVSQLIAAALRRFVALPYLAQDDRTAAHRAEDLAAENMRPAVCATKHSEVSRDQWTFADTNPAANATPLQIAELLATDFEAPGAVVRAPGAVFGVATRRGLLFEHGDLRGTSVGVVAISCS
jgi:hypothetical protein